MLNKLIMIMGVAIIILCAGVQAMPHGYLVKMLDNPGKVSTSKTMTIAGEQRHCSEYPTENYTVYIPDDSGWKLNMRCRNEPSLINLYKFEDDLSGVHFIDEYESPHIYKVKQKGYYYWECYRCPSQDEGDKECFHMPVACRTMTSYQVCVAGHWVGEPIPCGGDTYCDNGDCVDPTTVHPKWICSDWGKCYDNGKQYRVCYDARATGSTQDMPETVRNCVIDEGASQDTGSDNVTIPGGELQKDEKGGFLENNWLLLAAGGLFLIGLLVFVSALVLAA